MRDFSVFFGLGGLFAVGWSCFLWGVLSRFIKLLVEGMVGYSLSLKNRKEESILEADVPRLLACWTQTLILIGALQLSLYVVTNLESHRNMKMFKIYQSWGCDWLLFCIWSFVYARAPAPPFPPSPFSPAVSWGFGTQNQANHIIIAQMAIISVCDSDNRSQDAAGFGKFQLSCRDGSRPRIVSEFRFCFSL